MEPKYKIGEKAFYVKDNLLVNEVIQAIFTAYSEPQNEKGAHYLYCFKISAATTSVYSHEWIEEGRVYESKDEYIKNL